MDRKKIYLVLAVVWVGIILVGMLKKSETPVNKHSANAVSIAEEPNWHQFVKL